MTNEPAEDGWNKNQREPSDDSRLSDPQSEPMMPPLIVDGPELVRDSHC